VLDFAQYTFRCHSISFGLKPKHPQPLPNHVGVARLIVMPRLIDLVTAPSHSIIRVASLQKKSAM